jgi:hypothetical protein
MFKRTGNAYRGTAYFYAQVRIIPRLDGGWCAKIRIPLPHTEMQSGAWFTAAGDEHPVSPRHRRGMPQPGSSPRGAWGL